MPSPRRYIDPGTGDYALSRGACSSDQTHASDVYRRLATRLGSSAIDPGYGSRLHEIRTVSEQTARLAESMAVDTLKPVVAAASIYGLRVSAATAGSKILLSVSWKDRTGAQNHITYTHRVGS